MVKKLIGYKLLIRVTRYNDHVTHKKHLSQIIVIRLLQSAILTAQLSRIESNRRHYGLPIRRCEAPCYFKSRSSRLWLHV